ncbi:MAG: NADH:flavin oxidoreductase/NADH oxidase family protein [Pseudomonadota bacterium]
MALTDPLILPCGARLKNRLAKAAMTEGLSDAANRATHRHQTLYKKWAETGAGLLLTGNIIVDRSHLERPGNVVLDGNVDEEGLLALSRFAESAVKAGSDVWVQLSHAGRQSPKSVASEPVGPSAVPLALPGGQFGRPRALTDDEIEDIIQKFAAAARTAKSAGFTGVQIHAAHGYLVSEFLNPLANQRNDEWGGSLENRARLLLRLVESVRTQVGSGYPVSVKLNSSDFQKGGFSFDECLLVVELLNQAGVDLLEISGGNYEQPKMMGLDGLELVFEESIASSTRAREAYFIQYAEEVAKVANMPVMVTGGFRTRAAMEDALTSGACSIVGIGRPFCVAPEAIETFLKGELDTLPSPEKSLSIGPGIFGRSSSLGIMKVINGFGAMAYFYQNIFRLADGLEPDLTMPILPALIRHQRHELAAAKALIR